MKRFRLLAAVIPFVMAGGIQPAVAQTTPGKRPLTIADYRHWRSIDGARISDDGAWVAWSYSRVRGDDTLHVRNLETGDAHLVANGSAPAFSDDGRWVAYFISLPFAEAERKRRDDEPVTRKVGLLHLTSGNIRTWDDADSFGFSPGSSHLLVKKNATDSDADHDGTDIILRNLRDGFDELIGSVDDAAFNDAGSYLAYTVDAADRDGNGLYIVDLVTGARRGLDNAAERYARLTWSDEGNALAVLRGDTPDNKVRRDNTLLAFTDVSRPQARALTATAGLTAGWVLSENGALVWNDDATMLFVGTQQQQDELEDWGEDGLPLADVNIWHWADDRIQSQQQQAADRDRNRTYVAAARIADGNLVALADTVMRTVEITRDGRWGIGRDDRDYVSDWRPSVANYYRVDTRNGQRVEILREQLRTLGLSPDSRHYLYWKDSHIWTYRIDRNEHINLTASAPVSFVNTEFDRFGEKPPYGVGGWTADGDAVLLYDRYDVWLQPLDGSQARNLTQGRGTAEETRFRIVETDPDADAIDLDEPVLLETFGQWTKNQGFYRLDGSRLTQLTWEPRRFSTPTRATNTDHFLFTAQTWTEFPDLWVSDWDFTDRDRVTEANPQQKEFLWGTRILFDYETDDGIPLQGTLAIPEGYEPGQRLPMIVRFYEKYSQNLHVYPTPIYRHQPNFAGYVSNGYLLMQPDVHFRIGSSHSDMLEAVEAATRKVIELGYADPEQIGLSGHSYSGGGGAYIATRSKMFAAVAHGAAPINLVSEFNQLFVGSGQNNHRYDIYGQGRYATNPYDDFQLYWDQSPISGVETMDTPVLYLHGEDDPTVNWEQGLEWYNALRFLGKPIIWLSYPDEGHGLRKLENRIDFQFRLREFFDHHLRGEPAPEWMTKGVPYLDKGRHIRQYQKKIFRAKPRVTAGG